MNFDVLVNKYSKLVYKVCFDLLKHEQDALDAVQDTYLKLYKNINKYCELDDNSIKNIICKIAVNTCKDILKSKQFKIVINTIDDNIVFDDSSYDDIYVDEIINLINNLSDAYKDIIYEYLVNKESLDYISEKYNVDKNVLKVKINRGKKY